MCWEHTCCGGSSTARGASSVWVCDFVGLELSAVWFALEVVGWFGFLTSFELANHRTWPEGCQAEPLSRSHTALPPQGSAHAGTRRRHRLGLFAPLTAIPSSKPDTGCQLNRRRPAPGPAALPAGGFPPCPGLCLQRHLLTVITSSLGLFFPPDKLRTPGSSALYGKAFLLELGCGFFMNSYPTCRTAPCPDTGVFHACGHPVLSHGQFHLLLALSGAPPLQVPLCLGLQPVFQFAHGDVLLPGVQGRTVHPVQGSALLTGVQLRAVCHSLGCSTVQCIAP